MSSLYSVYLLNSKFYDNDLFGMSIANENALPFRYTPIFSGTSGATIYVRASLLDNYTALKSGRYSWAMSSANYNFVGLSDEEVDNIMASLNAGYREQYGEDMYEE